MHDVIIVGAGPIGLYAARLIKSFGLNVVVLEEHEVIGKPVQCSGLVSTALNLFMDVKESFVEHTVNGCILHGPFRTKILMKKKGVAAYVIDREGFDRYLSKGIDVRLGTKVEDIFVEDTVKVETNKGIFESKLLLGCDGPYSVVGKSLGSQPKEILTGITALVNEKIKSPWVRIWIDKSVAPEGFLWMIPRGKKTEYGMWSEKPRFKDLENFFDLRDYQPGGGPIPLGPRKTFFERVLLVGDAAAQVKPWSGGGIVYGLLCARIAAKTVKMAFDYNNFSEAFLKRYEDSWKGILGVRIQAGMLLRKVFKGLENPQIELVLSFAKIFQPILNRLDMDFLIRV